MRPLGILLIGGLLAACGSSTSVSLNEDPGKYAGEVARLQEHLSDHPDDADALRDLGAIYMRTDRPAKAYDRLKTAFAQAPNDPKTIFFLGLASEGVGKNQAALKLFARYEDFPTDSRYRPLMEGRYEWLVRLEAQKTIRELMQREAELAARNVSPRVVAVLPLQYQGGNDKYAAIGRGLAEMMTTDLAQIDRLRLVERVRLQALLDELKLAQSKYVDASTAPRVGKLLGAGRLVGGSYFVTQNEQLRLDLTLAEVSSNLDTPEMGTQTGALSDLFRIQKELVFRVVDLLGVDLTEQERAAIEPVPTRNLQAFLAYSRGLMEEDRGNFQAAVQQYRQAQQLDPGFDAPAKRQSKAKGLDAAAGSREKALSSAIQAGVQAPTIDLMNQRFQNMGYGLVAPTVERDPAEEAAGAEERVLANPPAPPARGGGQ